MNTYLIVINDNGQLLPKKLVKADSLDQVKEMACKVFINQKIEVIPIL